MPRRLPFYISENLPQLKRRQLRTLIKREVDRIFANDPEGDRLPYQITRYLLAILACGALVITLATAPGLARGLAYFVRPGQQIIPDQYQRKLKKYRRLKQVIERLRKQKLIAFQKKHGNETQVIVTKKGELRILSFALKDLAIPKQEKWDGKWRLIIFDIPETKRIARDVFRQKLRELGFLQLQKSAFVYPYPCEEEIAFLASIFWLWPYVTFIETDSLGRQEPEARDHFDLL